MKTITALRGQPLPNNIDAIHIGPTALYIIQSGHRRDFGDVRALLGACELPLAELASECGISLALKEGEQMELLMHGYLLTRRGDKTWPTPPSGATYNYEPSLRSSWVQLWFASLSEANAHFQRVCKSQFQKRSDGALSATRRRPGCIESREFTRQCN